MKQAWSLSKLFLLCFHKFWLTKRKVNFFLFYWGLVLYVIDTNILWYQWLFCSFLGHPLALNGHLPHSFLTSTEIHIYNIQRNIPTQDVNQGITVTKCKMHLQHLKRIPPTIPKDLNDDHETYTVSKNQPNKNNYHSLLCLLPMQRNQRNLHLSSSIVDLLSSPSATANLHFI